MFGKEDLVEIYQDTVHRCKRSREPQIVSTKMTFVQHFDLSPFETEEKTEILVENIDTLCAAEKYFAPDIVVFNFASDFVPGGGVRKGSRAQEEELFRRTDYHLTLSYRFYPLESKELIYSPRVNIVKSQTYQWKDQRIPISAIACAAIRRPRTKRIDGVDRYHDDKDRQLMFRKIESVLQIAIEQRHKTIVLGAFGCGAFGNPPREVAELFSKALEIYGRYFKSIIFAILGEGQNLQSFQSAFRK